MLPYPVPRLSIFVPPVLNRYAELMIDSGSHHRHTELKQHLFPLVLAAVVVLLQLLGPDVLRELRYERADILSGQIWRLMSGHLVHLGWSHLALNAAALGVIWLLFRQEWPQRVWLLIFIIDSLAISAGLLAFHPQLDWSVGLSGALHGLFAAGATSALRTGHRPAALMLGILAAKLLWEQLYSPMPGSEQWIGGAVITAAHLYGALTGLLLAAVLPHRGRRLRTGGQNQES